MTYWFTLFIDIFITLSTITFP